MMTTMTIRCAPRRGSGVSRHNSGRVVLLATAVDHHRKSYRGRVPKPVGRFANTPIRRREWMCNSTCHRRARREMLRPFFGINKKQFHTVVKQLYIVINYAENRVKDEPSVVCLHVKNRGDFFLGAQSLILQNNSIYYASQNFHHPEAFCTAIKSTGSFVAYSTLCFCYFLARFSGLGLLSSSSSPSRFQATCRLCTTFFIPSDSNGST